MSEYFQFQTVSSIFSFSAADAPGPLETPLYTPKPPFGVHYFGDLFQILQMSKLETPYMSSNGKLISQYPPLGHWLFYPFNFLNANLVVLFCMVCFLVIAVWSISIVSRLVQSASRAHFMLLACLSGPMVSIIDRGNITVLIFASLVVCLFVEVSPFSKNVLQIFSVALKIFPLVFCLEIARGKTTLEKWKSLVYVLSGASVLSFIGLAALGGGMWRNSLGFLTAFSDQTKTSSNVLIPGISLASFVDNSQELLGSEIGPSLRVLIMLGSFVLCIVAIILQYRGRISVSSRIEERLIITVAGVCLLPTVVGTYQLIFLLIPMAFYIEQDRAKHRLSLNSLLLILLVLPTRYEVGDGVYLSSLITAPILLLLLINTLRMQGNRVRFAQST